jgi:aromatic-L-amino-acid decarboxylase
MQGEEEAESTDLDPADWDIFRQLGHRALDDMIDHIQTIRERPVWVRTPDDVRAKFRAELPVAQRSLAEVLDEFDDLIKPYSTGNGHPAFMGWVHGAGTPVGMIAEMLAAGLNANCGGRDHIGIEVERQITHWMRQAFGFPEGASGVFVTGTSMANFLAVLVARNDALGDAVRETGIVSGPQLCAYTSRAAHGCIVQAMQLAGLGSANLRLVPCGADGGMLPGELHALVEADKRNGLTPFLVVGTVGTVDTGAIDPLPAIADFCALQGLWFHVDGAFGALLAFAPQMRSMIAGMERADSIAFDFHKWAHVPYDAGFLLVRDGGAHRRAFANPTSYLTRSTIGLAAGETWPCDLGPDLSRAFRALKTWFTLQVFGTDYLGRCIVQTCKLAKYLEKRLRPLHDFRLAAPVTLNIVCFSVRSADPDRHNRKIVEILHVSGRAAPSITLVDSVAVIRCAIVNHRTTRATIDKFISDLERAAGVVFMNETDDAYARP